MKKIDLTPIYDFLGCRTPLAWVEWALANQELMLIDHAHCEKKAASSALNILYRYVDHTAMLQKMSRIAREELRHFEKVLDLMTERGIKYTHLTASRYAQALREGVRNKEPDRLVDILIIGAFIEARSCERFAELAPRLDSELANFYISLLRSEARHYQDYIKLAQLHSDQPIDQRIVYFRDLEAELILSKDQEFRFHSGIPSC